MVLTFEEAREHLRISPETLRKLIKNGEIVAVKAGGGRTSPYRITIDSLNEYIERNAIRPVPQS